MNGRRYDMKHLYYVKDNFKDYAKIKKYSVQKEDNKYFYCGDLVLEKDRIYHVIQKNDMCRCYGYDNDLIELQMMKHRLRQLEKSPNWRYAEEVAILKRKIMEKQAVYESIILSGK